MAKAIILTLPEKSNEKEIVFCARLTRVMNKKLIYPTFYAVFLGYPTSVFYFLL